jgi:predicted  nucleic acid-binding Zn-ribbon protein
MTQYAQDLPLACPQRQGCGATLVSLRSREAEIVQLKDKLETADERLATLETEVKFKTANAEVDKLKQGIAALQRIDVVQRRNLDYLAEECAALRKFMAAKGLDPVEAQAAVDQALQKVNPFKIDIEGPND